MLHRVPTGSDAEVEAPRGHGVDLRDRNRQRTGQPERRRRDERPESDSARLPCETGEGNPSVGRAWEAVAREGRVVIRAEEGVEPELLRQLGDGEEIVV